MKTLINNNKKWFLFFCLNFILIVLFAAFKLNNFTFLLCSIFANSFLLLLLKLILNKFNINFTKNEKTLICISIALIYLFYFVSVFTRKFIYYWDFSCYYNLQIGLEDAFGNGLFAGLKNFVGSTWSGEYGNFLSFFPELLFYFSNKSIDSYVLSCVIIYVPFLIISYSIFIKRLQEFFKVDKKFFFFSLLLTFILFPIVHATFLYGQPDLFGLFFIFLIISLTIDYDFKKLEFERLFLIAILTFMLLISRRWYIYFILSYYFCYLLLIVFRNISSGKLKDIFKNIILYFCVVAFIFLITLFPLFKNIIISNFDYSFYMGNGFFGELVSQYNHLGFSLFFVAVLGIIYGIIKKKFRLYTILFLIEYLIIIFMFTRMQNMGLHHCLLLVPNYIFFFFLFICFAFDKKIILFLYFFILLINFAIGVVSPYNNLYTDVLLRVPDDSEFDYIKSVSMWLKDNTNDDSIYMIFHNNRFNPDKFRNILLPDLDLHERISYGSAVIGVHKFPVELFESKYIVTVYPFENISIEWKYNKVFCSLVELGKFRPIYSITTDSGYVINIYERVVNVDLEEINMYKDILIQESNDYPSLFSQVIDEYVIKKRLIDN